MKFSAIAVFCLCFIAMQACSGEKPKEGTTMLKTQKEEFAYMVEILYIKGEYDDMWNELADMLNVPRPDGISNYTYNGAYFYSKADYKLDSFKKEIETK